MWVSANLLPLTVTVAISLFLTKEILEAIRRRRGDKRKLRAIRVALARECELNLWTIRSVASALKGAGAALKARPPNRFLIRNRPSGEDQWRRFDEHGEIVEGGPLPPVRTDAAMGRLEIVAELDKKLFMALEAGIGALAELDHLRGSLIDTSERSDPVEEVHFPSLIAYATNALAEVELTVGLLYIECTGRRLEKPRLR